jgi:hexosaminidase
LSKKLYVASFVFSFIFILSIYPKSAVAQLKAINQPQLDFLADKLIVKYRFLSNIETDCPALNNKKVRYCYSAEILFFLPQSNSLVTDWQLNFSQVYPAYASSSNDFTLQHINGDLHQIKPTKNFTGFKAGQIKKIKLWVKSTLITESELMPNYWLSADYLQPKVVASTRTKVDSETGLEIQPYVVPFSDLPKQLKSSPDDVNQYASTQWLFEQESALEPLSNKSLINAIIPTPDLLLMKSVNARLNLSSGIQVKLNGIKKSDVGAALTRLASLGIEEQPQGVVVTITKGKVRARNKSGSYELDINKDKINITALDSAGAFYALQSLASLLMPEQKKVPLVMVIDQPAYAYRGQHIDVARNFHSKEMLIRLIKQMAAYKLNKLHLHLAEDEAWRLALPSFPELTEIGSKRCMAMDDKSCLQPQLGGAGASERDGFYSVEDYKEILTVAKAHHIEVIPSLDMPGHSRAAIKAMEARYHYFMQQENEVEAKRYLLTDFNDKTEYSSIQNYHDNTLNICMESTYAFVDRVLDDLIEIHQQADAPLTTYHIGADETAGAWLESPECLALVANPNNDVDDVTHLGAHFIERISHMVVNKGINVGGWNDGLSETRVENMPKETYSYIWGALPWGAHQQVSEQSHRDWNIVLSIPDVLYFDFPYQIDPKERGYNWASRRVTTRTIFNFMPDNLPIHAEFRRDTLGKNFISDDRLQKDDTGKLLHQPLAKDFEISGIQGQLWSETVRSDSQAEYMIYPRLLALAERAWHKADWQVPYDHQGGYFDKNSGVFTDKLKEKRDQQWLTFSKVLTQKELPKLEDAGVFYRIPTVGAKIINGKLHANVALKGLAIEFRSLKGSNKKWQTYTSPIAVNLPVEVRAKSVNNQRVGRSLLVE